MKKICIILAMLLSPILPACAGCSKKDAARKVVEQTFPICFQQPKPGERSGADCSYNKKMKEWEINFWSCEDPSNCNPKNKQYTAWYQVNKKGEIQKCSGGTGSPDGFYSCEPFSTFSYRQEQKPQGISKLVNEDHKLFCNKAEECFWYSCCSTTPMSKLYSNKNFEELLMSRPDQQSCEAKCKHDSVPPGVKLECVAHMCMSVSDALPAVDPSRAVVWVGRPEVVGQCEQELRPLSPLNYAGAPVIIRETESPGITLGPEFNKKVAAWQKQTYDRNPGSFMCEACHVCKDFKTRYLLIFFDDLDKFSKGPDPWWRVDQ
jgi:hypothetical protein